MGNANPLSLSEYYAGGLYVPVGTTGNLGLIPAAGLITFDHFRGSSNITDVIAVLLGAQLDGNTNGYLAGDDGSLTPAIINGQFCNRVSHLISFPGRLDIFFDNALADDFFFLVRIEANRIGPPVPPILWTHDIFFLAVESTNVTPGQWEWELADYPWQGGGAGGTLPTDVTFYPEFPLPLQLIRVGFIAPQGSGFLTDLAGVPLIGNLFPQELSGSTIRAVRWDDLGGAFVTILGGHPQTFWTSMTIYGVTLLSADANHSQSTPPGGSLETVWAWPAELVAPWPTITGQQYIEITFA